MSQPEWKCVAQLGDADPLDYGGFFVLVDTTGVYAPEIELLESPDSDDNGELYIVSRIICEPHTFINGVLSDNPYHTDHPVWYADKIESVASFAGCEPSELISGLCSNDPIERAFAYRNLIDYFGTYEFDQYPLTLTRDECEQRYSQPQYQH